MFGLFKQKKSAESQQTAVLDELCQLCESLAENIASEYFEFSEISPVEQRFFAMSATSVFVQAFGRVPESDIPDLINKFTDLCVANMIFHIPRADFSLVHGGFISRFADYSHLIVDVHDADNSHSLGGASFALINTMDRHFRVERDAIERSIAGMMITSILTHYASSVNDAVAR